MNRKIKKIRKYRNDYREPKNQIKKHMCRFSCISREYQKKKNYFNEQSAQINYINDVLTKR